MSFLVTAPYATWKTSAWSFDFTAPHGDAFYQAKWVFPRHRHFLLLAENAGCILGGQKDKFFTKQGGGRTDS
jgi:hypothetical protein